MKKHLILTSGVLALLILLIGVVMFFPAGAQTINGNAKFDPDRIDLALPASSIVKAIIRFDQPYNVKDINSSTVLLESALLPSTTYLIPGGLVAEFDGDKVVNIIWSKIYHIGTLAPPYKIWLTITGNLNDSAGGTAFSAQGSIKIIVSNSPPPP